MRKAIAHLTLQIAVSRVISTAMQSTLGKSVGSTPANGVAPQAKSFALHSHTPVQGSVKSLQGAPLANRAARRAAKLSMQKSITRAVAKSAASTTSTPMSIVFVSTEVSPWSKTGGLGDVVGGLPIELAKRGHKVMSVAPRYDQYSDAWDTSVTANIDGEEVRYFHTKKKGVDRVWVDHPTFLAKVWGQTGAKLYGPRSGADYEDNQLRFKLFCQAAIEACRVLPFSPGEECIIVANDWHAALVPVLLKDVYQPSGQFLATKVAYCVHNIAFQGRFWPEDFQKLGLPESSTEKFTFQDGYNKVFSEKEPVEEDSKSALGGGPYDKVNWLKAGFLSADKVLTVSPNYALEIQESPAKGVELDDVIRAVGVEGIVNGMDITEWSPKVDKFLDVKYDKDTVVEGKAAAKEALQAELGLPVDPSVPLFGFIGRLEEQKGVDILLAAIPEIVGSADAQIVILGTGKKSMETEVKALDKKYSDKVKGVVKFSAPLAHMITAGADYIFVPSRFEPCGLIQLHAMQYGTVPLVASTGGLVDTVKEGATGFHMGAFDADKLDPADAQAVAETAIRAATVYGTPKYTQMSAACINQDLSWEKPARKWEAILMELKYGVGEQSENKKKVVTPVEKIEQPFLAGAI